MHVVEHIAETFHVAEMANEQIGHAPDACLQEQHRKTG